MGGIIGGDDDAAEQAAAENRKRQQRSNEEEQRARQKADRGSIGRGRNLLVGRLSKTLPQNLAGVS